MSNKTCNKCLVSKNVSEFYKHAGCSQGVLYTCKECHKFAVRKRSYEPKRNARIIERSRAFSKRPEQRWKNYFYTVKKKYGLLEEDFIRILDSQNGRCVTCFEKIETVRASGTGRQRLHVDHCHVSDEVRGLLCADCNVALGRVKDSIPILERMIEYLKECQSIGIDHSHFEEKIVVIDDLKFVTPTCG